jgi:hypothetical protein
MDVQVTGGWLARNWQAMFGGVAAGVAGGVAWAHRKKKK